MFDPKIKVAQFCVPLLLFSVLSGVPAVAQEADLRNEQARLAAAARIAVPLSATREGSVNQNFFFPVACSAMLITFEETMPLTDQSSPADQNVSRVQFTNFDFGSDEFEFVLYSYANESQPALAMRFEGSGVTQITHRPMVDEANQPSSGETRRIYAFSPEIIIHTDSEQQRDAIIGSFNALAARCRSELNIDSGH